MVVTQRFGSQDWAGSLLRESRLPFVGGAEGYKTADMVRTSQSLPLGMTLTYYLVLPPLSRFVSMFQAYEALPIYDVDSEEEEDDPEEIARIVAEEAAHVHDLHLSFKDKMELAKPLIKSYMLPLFLVYFAGTSVRFRFAFRC